MSTDESIVFVHGLNGHPQKTWTASNGTFWPRDLLPANLGEVRARILVWGYNADVYAFGGKSTNADYVHAHALTLVANLVADRLVRVTSTFEGVHRTNDLMPVRIERQRKPETDHICGPFVRRHRRQEGEASLHIPVSSPRA